jgi:hypothetical protein
MARALSWFKQIYNFEFEKVLSDNGPEFKGSLNREHPIETMCNQLGIKHIYTTPYRKLLSSPPLQVGSSR